MFLARYFQSLPPDPDMDEQLSAQPVLEPAPLPVIDPVLRYSALGVFVILFFAALHLSRAFAMPIVAGLVIGFVLGPAADRLARYGLPQSVAAGLIVLMAALFLIAAAANTAAPLAEWIDQLPAMISALQAKAAGLLDVITRVKSVSNGAETAAAVAVEKSNPVIDIFSVSSTIGAQLLLFTCTVYFYLATRRQIVARTLWLVLDKQARRPAYGFFEAVESHVAIYFGVVTLVNLGVGVFVAVVAWLGGLGYPLLWGALAAILNYVPYVGPMIVFGALLSAKLIQDVELIAVFWPAAAFVSMHVLEANVVTPSLVGRRFTVSPLLVFLSFAFWLWLWGPVGAMLASPLLLVAVLARASWREYRETVAPDGVVAASVVVPATQPDSGTKDLQSRSENGKSGVSSDVSPVKG